MKILFLACLSPKTGNHTTAGRIRSHIEKAGHTCELRDVREFQSSTEVAELLTRYQFQSALGIHLFKAGRFLLDIQIPFGIIFGGTDVNEDVKVEQKRVVMEQVLLQARFAVAFTEELKREAEMFLLSQSSKIYVQPQGVQTDVSDSFSWTEFLRSAGVHTEHGTELRVFLLVCGLRRVKDPLYLVEDFSEWHCGNPLNVFVIIGPKVLYDYGGKMNQVEMKRICIDPVFTLEVEAVVQRTAGISLALERSQQELHAAMKRCFALVNSSLSEGMSAAILEAMDLGVPVLARNIPGNASVVQHEFTGLLYSSPQEFVRQSQRLVSDCELRKRLVRNGKQYVEERHNLKRERETYQQLVETLLAD